jgi:TetR/AcrR family transcriptional regulator, transcriptional repressor for nem operon
MEQAPRPVETVPTVESTGLTKGERTRERILDLAYDAIIHKGFSGTSIDELVEAVGITKSGFFYHFKDKGDLASQLLVRFLAEDDAIMDRLTLRAQQLADDPLQRFLLFLNLYAEMVDGLEELHPGCLVASVVYQDQMFDREIQRLNSEAVMRWRARFLGWIEAIDEKYKPVLPVDNEALADGLSAVVEGSIVLAKALNDPKLMGRQLRLYRDMVKTTYGVS